MSEKNSVQHKGYTEEFKIEPQSYKYDFKKAKLKLNQIIFVRLGCALLIISFC